VGTRGEAAVWERLRRTDDRSRPEGAAVLTITDTAAEAIRGIVAAPELPDGAGLRIATATGSGDAASLEVSVAETPAESDQVVTEAGARVFVEADAVPLLDDKLLDAQIEGTRVGFMLSEQQA
jgi:iron-sulfur cluster assembly protein